MYTCDLAWAKRILTRNILGVILLGAVTGTLAAKGGTSLRFAPPVARPIEMGRESRRSLDDSPGSGLDARSALLAANAIAAQVPGAQVFTVLPTGSMRPVFDEKAFVVVEPTQYNELKIGDIITYLHPKLGTPVIHRIMEKRAEGYWTKGDHNARPDDVYVTPENYLMRVFAIVYARENGNSVRQGPIAGAMKVN